MSDKQTSPARHVVEPPADRRSAERYQLALPVTFLWKNRHGSRCKGQGLTRDVSRLGAFVISHSCPPAGARVRVELFLPPVKLDSARAELKATGRVARVDLIGIAEGSSGFAVVTQRFSLMNRHAGSPPRTVLRERSAPAVSQPVAGVPSSNGGGRLPQRGVFPWIEREGRTE